MAVDMVNIMTSLHTIYCVQISGKSAAGNGLIQASYPDKKSTKTAFSLQFCWRRAKGAKASEEAYNSSLEATYPYKISSGLVEVRQSYSWIIDFGRPQCMQKPIRSLRMGATEYNQGCILQWECRRQRLQLDWCRRWKILEDSQAHRLVSHLHRTLSPCWRRGPLRQPWPKHNNVACYRWVHGAIVSTILAAIYSTVSLVPPISTMEVWRGIT